MKMNFEIFSILYNKNKIKSFKIYKNDEDNKGFLIGKDDVTKLTLVGNSLENALEILENNGYIVEVKI
tara:strand:+ start:378 stop:581 length:204 start_codon:yes stop_codon:yes gene_type:complete